MLPCGHAPMRAPEKQHGCERRYLKSPHQSAALPPDRSAAIAGIACGIGAAVFWAVGFVAARHGIAAGFSPADIVLHRFVWAGLAFLPLIVREGFADLGWVGWRRGVLLTLIGGPPFSHLSYAGFLLVPLAHGAVIQPSCAAIGGLLLATAVLGEKLPARRAAGAAVIVLGLVVIGGDALATIGTHGLLGDFAFAAAGLLFATFSVLLLLWHIVPMRAVMATSVVALLDLPVHWLAFGFEHIIAPGLYE